MGRHITYLLLLAKQFRAIGRDDLANRVDGLIDMLIGEMI